MKKTIETCSFLFMFIWLYLIAMHGLQLYDDYSVYVPALKVAHGQILYKEAYTQYGPIMVYIQAAFIKLFGERLWSLRISAILFYMLAFYLYYYVFKMFLPYWIVLLSEIFLVLLEPSGYSVFHSWSSIYALVFIMILMIFFLKYMETYNYIYVILSGIDAAIIFFCRQSCGLVFIIGTILLWIILGWLEKKNVIKNVAGAILGIFTVIGLAALYFYMNGCLVKWIQSALIEQFGLLQHFVDSYGLTMENTDAKVIIPMEAMGNSRIIMLINCLFPIRLMGIFFFLPFVLVIDFVYYLYKVKIKELNVKDIKIFIVLFLCTVSWHQYFPLEGNLKHVYWAAFPMMGLFVLNIYNICKYIFKKYTKESMAKYINIITCFVLFIAVAPTLYHRIDCSLESIKSHDVISTKECKWLDGIMLTEEENNFFVGYYNYINNLKRQYPNMAIYNYTFMYLPECEIMKNSITENNAEAILYIRKKGQYEQLDKYMSFTDSFPMLCEFYMELVVN